MKTKYNVVRLQKGSSMNKRPHLNEYFVDKVSYYQSNMGEAIKSREINKKDILKRVNQKLEVISSNWEEIKLTIGDITHLIGDNALSDIVLKADNSVIAVQEHIIAKIRDMCPDPITSKIRSIRAK